MYKQHISLAVDFLQKSYPVEINWFEVVMISALKGADEHLQPDSSNTSLITLNYNTHLPFYS